MSFKIRLEYSDNTEYYPISKIGILEEEEF